jgi:hypothetical protein
MSSTHNPATITYEQMMALFLETRERMEEAAQGLKETKKLVERVSKDISNLGDRLGELVQEMVEGGVIRMFKELGYDFDVVNPKQRFGNKSLGIYGEIDLFLENGDYALLVEVKTNLSVKDVKEHGERLQDFRLVADAKNDKRQFIAAVGGGVVQENVKTFALKQGMFVVQQSGENMEVLVPKGKPTIW